jgi:hypothetical protein
MTPSSIRHTLSAIATSALLFAFAGSPALAQGVWDDNEQPRGNLFSPNHAGQSSPAQSRTPSMSRPSTAKNRERSKSLSPDVQKELSLTDDQK